MKALFLIITISLTAKSFGQIKGMESYAIVSERSWDISSKIHLFQEDEYEYLEFSPIDGEVSKAGIALAFRELERVFSENGVELSNGEIISYNPRIGTSKQDIDKAIRMGERFIMIRYRLNEYYAYLNLQDEFCGIVITKEKIE